MPEYKEDYSKAHIKGVLMHRDECTAEEAQDRIDEAQREFDELLDGGDLFEAERICEEHFGLSLIL